MKKTLPLLALCLLVTACLPAFAQKYKSASDTVKLNKEWVDVSNDIAKLNAETYHCTKQFTRL